jgi:hypothetical protein
VIEYTSYPGIVRTTGPGVYERAYQRREAKLRAALHPDLHVSGVCVPYGPTLDFPGVGKVRFSYDTQWDFDLVGVPLKGNHSSLLGMTKIFEDRRGLLVDGRVDGNMRKYARGKPWLSASLEIDVRRGYDGMHDVVAGTVFEVSLVDHAHFEPHTPATVLPAA